MPDLLGERPATRCTTAHFVVTLQLGKITYRNTYADTLARSLTVVLIVAIAQPPSTVLLNTWEYTLGRSLLLAPCVLTEPLSRPLWGTTLASMRMTAWLFLEVMSWLEPSCKRQILWQSNRDWILTKEIPMDLTGSDVKLLVKLLVYFLPSYCTAPIFPTIVNYYYIFLI